MSQRRIYSISLLTSISCKNEITFNGKEYAKSLVSKSSTKVHDVANEVLGQYDEFGKENMNVGE